MHKRQTRKLQQAKLAEEPVIELQEGLNYKRDDPRRRILERPFLHVVMKVQDSRAPVKPAYCREKQPGVLWLPPAYRGNNAQQIS